MPSTLFGRVVFFLTTLVITIRGFANSATSEDFHLFAAPQTVRSDEVTLLWDKPTTPVSSYEILLDDQPFATTNKTHFRATGLKADQAQRFTVIAKTAIGTTAQRSNSLTLRTSEKEAVVSVEKFGAKGDGLTMNTKAIQAAIDACPKNGIVLIPAGVFLSGALFLKSDLTLHIAQGGVLQGSTVPADYEPFIRNRFEGWELDTYASLLNAGKIDHRDPANVRNLSIRGEGKISGGGDVLGKAMIAAHGLRGRGRLICLMNCENVEVAGLTLDESPCWTLHYIYSENVSIHGLTINSDLLNGDGIDPDSSKNSYIFNCTFSNGDDCIAIKSGKNPEGNLIGRPTENVWIVDCQFKRGHGISIGSEISGGVRNVLVQDCVAGNLLNGMQIKATRDRGNIVENITVRDCDLQKISILTALNYNNDGAPAATPPLFRNFRFENLDLTAAEPGKVAIIVNGYAEPAHRTTNVGFKNVKLAKDSVVKVDQSEKINFTNVVTSDGQKPKFEVTRSDSVSY